MLAAGMMLSSLQLFAAESDTISINDQWLFHLSLSEAAVPQHFASPSFSDRQWIFQDIPGTWNVQHAWRNKSYVGLYRGWIKLPSDLKDRRLYLHVGTTTAVTDVYVNGTLVGKTDSDRAQTEFEITPLVKLGQRNLFAFHMPRFDAGEDLTNKRGRSGITSSCFIYSLDTLHMPAPAFVPQPAHPNELVCDRRSFEPETGFTDSPSRMREDLRMMKRLGFGAVTAGRLTTAPQFLYLARQEGMDVVADAPSKTGRFVDSKRQFTSDALALLEVDHFDYAAERNAALARAGEPTGRQQRIWEEDNLLYISGSHHKVAFDKRNGYLFDYKLCGVKVIQYGTVMPNVRATLVSLRKVKSDRTTGTVMEAIYDVSGEKVRWTYTIWPNGVIRLQVEGTQDIKIEFESRMSKMEFLAQGADGEEDLTSLTMRRPHVFWWKQTNKRGKGVEIIGDSYFTALYTNNPNLLVIRHGRDAFDLTFAPVKAK